VQKEYNRTDRVAAAIKRILAQPLADLVSEASVGLVTMSDVDVSPDLKKATVLVTAYSDRGSWISLENHLNENGYILQGILSRQLRSKRTPILLFRVDDSLAQTDRINKLIFESSD
jgi:ribosome-binding factor A